MSDNIQELEIQLDKRNKISKKSKKVLIIIAVLLVLDIIGYFIINSKTNKSDNTKILVYTNIDKDLKYIYSKNDSPRLLSKSFDEQINVKFNENKTKIAYIKNRGLYLHDVNSKNESDKIGVDVDYYKFINDNELIYVDINKNLYVASSSNNKTRIDIDVTNIIYINENIVIYNKGKDVYLYNTTSQEKNSILKDYDSDKKIRVSNDLKQILYVSTENQLKIYNIDNKNSSIKVEDVYDIIDCSNDFKQIVYTKLGEKKKYYELFINDNPADNPTIKYKCTIHDTFENKSGGVTSSDTKNNIYHIYDSVGEYIYYDEKGDWHFVTIELMNYCKGADPSKELKEQIRKDETSLQLYNLYSLSDEKENEIATNIHEVITSKNNTYVYTKMDISNENKVKISSISSINVIKDLVKQVNPTLCYSNDIKKDEILVNGFNTKYKDRIDIVNGKIYVYEINDKNELSLYEYDMSNNGKEKLGNKCLILKTNIMNYDILYLDNVNTETFKGDLIGRTNGKNTNIDTDIYSIIENDSDKLYYYKDYNSNSLSGNFIINNISKNKKISINDVSIVFKGYKDKYYIFKDYSTISKTFSLFLYEDEKQTPIEYNITDYVYSE